MKASVLSRQRPDRGAASPGRGRACRDFSYETRWSGARYTAALGTKSRRFIDGNVTEMLRTRLLARGAVPGSQRDLPAAGQAIAVSPRRFQKLMHYSNFCDDPCIAPSPSVDCRDTFYPGHRQRSLRIITSSPSTRARQGGCASLVNSYHALLALRAQARLLTSNNCQRRDCMRSSRRIRFPFGAPSLRGDGPSDTSGGRTSGVSVWRHG